MSQVEFAKYLNVGEASVKRWETFSIQDPRQDDDIRRKYNLIEKESNRLEESYSLRELVTA